MEKECRRLRMRSIPIIFFFSFLWILTAISTAAQEKPDFSGGLLDRAAVLKAAAKVTPDKYPDAAVVLVDAAQYVEYRADGTYEDWNDHYYKVMTEAGRSWYQKVSLSYTIPYNHIEFIAVEVIHPDGPTRTVDIKANTQVTIDSSQMYSNIYNPNAKILNLTVGDIQVGDVVHFIMVDRYEKVVTPGEFSFYEALEDDIPIRRYDLIIVGPKEKPLISIALKDEVPGTVKYTREESRDKIQYRWTAGNVPQVFREKDMPSLHSLVQRVLVSTIQDWPWLSKWYWRLCKPQLDKTTPEMNAKVEELTRGLEDRREKIKAIFYWVSQEIRYLGLTLENQAPGYEPHPVSLTFEKRAGVCRDKAALLTAMLRLAGFDAYPVLIMSGPKRDPEVASPWFNHAVTAVREPDGSYILMDSTDESTKDLFPAYLNDKSFLVASPEGETLLTSSIQPAEENMMFIDTAGTIDESGTLRAVTVIRLNGINDNLWRSKLAWMLPDEMVGAFADMVKDVVPGGQLSAFAISPDNMQDTSKPLEVRFSLEVEDFIINGREMKMLPLPRLARSLAAVHGMVDGLGLEERRYPIRTEVACGVKETIKIDLPQDFGPPISLPQTQNIENQALTLNGLLVVDENTLNSVDIFKMKLTEYTPEQYKLLKETAENITRSAAMMPIFQVAGPGQGHTRQTEPEDTEADGLIEESVYYKVQDRHTWTIVDTFKIKVLTYAGVKMYSEIKLDYTPVWENIRVEGVRVTSPKGEVREISPDEINIMDQGSGGLRYPAGKTLVVNLPGVEIGSVIEYTGLFEIKDQPFFNFLSWFMYSDPILKKTVTMDVPENLKLDILVSQQGFGLEKIWPRPAEKIIEESVKSKNGRKIYEFTAPNVPRPPMEDWLPPAYSYKPFVAVSAGTWKEIADYYGQALKAAAENQPNTAKAVGKLVASGMNEAAKIMTIRDFVDHDIQDSWPQIFSIPTSYISPADVTLKDGYGNSADRAVLLYSLLKTAGFQPEFVIPVNVSPLEYLQTTMRRIASVKWLSDDVMVRVKLDGSWVYLGDTGYFAVLGSTWKDRSLILGLDKGDFEILEALEECRDLDRLHFTIKLDPQGGAEVTETFLFYGMGFESFNRKFSNILPEARSRAFQQMVSSVSLSAKPISDLKTDYSSYPGKLEFTVKVDDYAVRQGDYLFLKLPGLLSAFDWLEKEKGNSPVYRGIYARSITDLEILLPEGTEMVEVTPPEDLVLKLVDNGRISYETRYEPPDNKAPGGRILVKQTIDLRPMVIPPEAFTEMSELNRRLSLPAARMLVLRMNK